MGCDQSDKFELSGIIEVCGIDALLLESF